MNNNQIVQHQEIDEDIIPEKYKERSEMVEIPKRAILNDIKKA